MRLEVLLLKLVSSLTILHTNDIHSHYDPTNELGMDCTAAQVKKGECYGGMARLKSEVDRIRNNRSDVLLLDAGDHFQGTMYYTYYKGNATWKFMNLLNYDAMTLGNHEFDDGIANLARVISNFNFPVVCANVEGLQGIVPYTLFPQHDLAVVGYITESTGRLSKIGTNVTFLDPRPVVQGVVDKVRSEGVSRVIALSHNGYFEDKKLAENTRGIALIVDGHSHTYLNSISKKPKSFGDYPTVVRNLDGELVYIIQAYCWGRFLGHVDVTFRPDGYLQSIKGAPIELGTDVPQDREALELMTSLSKPFDKFQKKVVGVAGADFNIGHCQSGECAMGNLLTDAFLNNRIPFGGQIALMNSGGIRATFSRGQITAQQVLNVLPFSNQLTQFPMTGEEIWEMLASAIARKSRRNNLPIISFVQVAGMRYTYDPEALALLSIQIHDNLTNIYHPIIPNQTYQVVAGDFLAAGGDNLILPPRTNLTGYATQSQILMDFINSHSPISPTLDNRIKSTSPTLALAPTVNLLQPAKPPTWRPTSLLTCLLFRCHN